MCVFTRLDSNALVAKTAVSVPVAAPVEFNSVYPLRRSPTARYHKITISERDVCSVTRALDS